MVRRKKIENKKSYQINEVVTEDGIIVVKAPEQIDIPSDRLPEHKVIISEQGMITIKAPTDNDQVIKECAKKIITNDMNGKPNGYLIELFKADKKTTTYMSTVKPGKFKGYHLHKVRTANYVCINGKIKIILYTPQGRQEYILSADVPERLHIPANIPTGLFNEGDVEAWIINDPFPAYDPELKNEQVEYTEAECEAGLHLRDKKT